mgnify:CR=1 FL=1
MTENDSVEVALTQDELASILRICSPDALLVGGQALAFWVDRLAVPRPPELAASITTDADFIGNADIARRLGRGLGWKTWIPSLEDATPQIAKVTHVEVDGSIKQVDFLSGIVGLTTKDVRRRAQQLDVSGVGTIAVLHPVDVLDSRIQNLHLLPSKRNPAGFAQARLAIAMVKAFIRAESVQDDRPGLKLLERVVSIAQDHAALLVHVLYGIDVLAAVPHDTLLVHGREDRIIPLSSSLRLLDLIPNAQLHVFGRCGHWTQIEQSDRFVRLVVDFLSDGTDRS